MFAVGMMTSITVYRLARPPRRHRRVLANVAAEVTLRRRRLRRRSRLFALVVFLCRFRRAVLLEVEVWHSVDPMTAVG